MEQHIAFALEVVQNEITRLENELQHGHYLKENVALMELDIQRLRAAISEIGQKFKSS